jgi:hypothetical protein
LLVKHHKNTIFLEFELGKTIADLKVVLSQLLHKELQDLRLVNVVNEPYSDTQPLATEASPSYAIYYLVYRLPSSEWEPVSVPPYPLLE